MAWFVKGGRFMPPVLIKHIMSKPVIEMGDASL
jgi:hypothetical protein